jgi:hypothetical protein
VLVRYKEELSRPFDEAASFLSSIQAQLSNLCSAGSSPAATATHSGEEIKPTRASLYVPTGTSFLWRINANIPDATSRCTLGLCVSVHFVAVCVCVSKDASL